ncbi:MAG: hypothetical protein QOJ92_1293 [Frankiales bacterium]|nr:hypothetical protein [Frankiales bacterium]MDX6274083.1 hypothetical protein [Frankiales bacterium]
MSMFTRHRRSGIAVALTALTAALGAAVAAPAGAAAHDQVRVTQVSGPNAMPQCTAWPTSDAQTAAMRDWDVEPALAASPSNPDHLVAAWMTGYSDAISAAVSDDGGSSWSVHGVTVNDCTKYHSAFDPSVAIGRDVDSRTKAGEVTYLVTDTAAPPSGTTAPLEALRPSAGAYPDTGVVVLTSYDGTAGSWGTPTVLDRASDVESIDGSHVTVDPAHSGTAYVLWSKANIYTFARDVYLATTVDGGRHWSAPTRLPATPAGTIAIGTRLVVGPGGAIAALSSAVPEAQYAMALPGPLYDAALKGRTPHTVGPTELVVTTKAFGGAWTAQRTIADMDPARFTNVGVGWNASGQIAASWVRVDTATIQPMVIESADGGLTWGAARAAGPAVESAPFLAGPDIVAPPTVLVDGGGRPSLVFYDHRNDNPAAHPAGDPPHTTQAWARQFGDGAWSEQRVLGPFDGTAGPAGDGSFCDTDCTPTHSFFGDYFGGVTMRKDGLGVVLGASNPRPDSPHNTDLYFVRLDRGA